MNRGQKQVIAEKIASTVRVLELLGFDYEVAAPKKLRAKGNKSPRVVTVKFKGEPFLWVYNSADGYTWANWVNGDPALGIGSIEALHEQLKESKFATARDRHISNLTGKVVATAGKKAALTRKRRAAARKAAVTRKRRAAARKAAVTRAANK